MTLLTSSIQRDQWQSQRIVNGAYMIKRIPAVIMFFALPVSFVFANQTAIAKPESRSFSLHRGQLIYIAAYRKTYLYSGTKNSRPSGPIIASKDLPLEARLAKEFDKWRDFKIASKLSEADFVFVVLFNSSAAEGLMISRDDYNRFKENPDDVDGIREAALKRYLVGPFALPTLGKVSSKIVEEIHLDFAGTKTD
jgi:hypothetical protein